LPSDGLQECVGETVQIWEEHMAIIGAHNPVLVFIASLEKLAIANALQLKPLDVPSVVLGCSLQNLYCICSISKCERAKDE